MLQHTGVLTLKGVLTDASWLLFSPAPPTGAVTASHVTVTVTLLSVRHALRTRHLILSLDFGSVDLRSPLFVARRVYRLDTVLNGLVLGCIVSFRPQLRVHFATFQD